MSIVVQKAGILSTVQDLGRLGFRSLGINPNGVMDRSAARLINVLLGNDENEAVFELHFTAAEFVFQADCSFAIGGADLGANLNGVELDTWSVSSARSEDILRFSEPRLGSRAYLAVAGGFRIPEWLGSRSTNIAAEAGGLHGRRLQAGDRIEFAGPRRVNPRRIGPSMIPNYSRSPTVRVVAGGEFDELTATSERAFLNENFKVSRESNRMGFRLSGEALFLLSTKDLVSAGVTFGTLQLLPDGQLIMLMADHQTSGGYPRVANVIGTDLPVLAQLGYGDKVGFQLVSIDEAEHLALRFEQELMFLKLGVRFCG